MESNMKKFTHLEIISKSDIPDESDFLYLKNKNLLKQKDSGWIVDFVGEVITPVNSYFSLPKNFNVSETKNINLIRLVLDFFEKTMNSDWKSLIYNQYFEPDIQGDFESEKYYFNELKSYFLDYITYEFIYPLNKLKIHSGTALKGGKLDVLSSVQNRKRFGTGFTYDVKDVKNSDEWMIDDIYYHTLDKLCSKYGTQNDRRDIEEMRKYLENEGYEILLDQSGNPVEFEKKFPQYTTQDIINSIHKSQVSAIHYPIRDTLLEYYEGRKLKETSYRVRVFYTTNFEKVWEELSKKALYHNEEFKDELKTEKNTDGTNKFKFSKIETISKWFPKSQIDSKLAELSKKGAKISEDNPLIIEWQERSLEPDIFSWVSIGQKDISFLGDAKYYNEPDSEYSKEMNDYNEAVNNKFPMCIFCCSEMTTVSRSRRTGNKELIIFLLSTQECINVAINRLNGREDYSLLRKVHKLIEKYTRRKGLDYLGGF